ncbi:MAG TPA: carboxypeptidase-like regulatory domain-containing protein, partial [Gillisia sp.]|nr:carboxypeptidase-like regulatory domain-containing protein [Gillisia sp.]
MKRLKNFILPSPIFFLLGFLIMVPVQKAEAAFFQEFTEYKGKVVDANNGNPIAAAFLAVEGTNISTVTNNEGEFSLKVPVNISSANVTISNLGYQSKTLPLSVFNTENTRIELNETLEELSEVNIFTATDAKALVRNMFSKAGDNYLDDPVIMNSFYREAIKKGRRNVSLTEAVLKIFKRPYTTTGRDEISIIKARKSVDYERLDTMALKLRGGPFNTLYSDIIKYPEYLFNVAQLDEYTFTFGSP